MKNAVKLCLTNSVMNVAVVVLEIHTTTREQTAQLKNLNHPNVGSIAQKINLLMDIAN